MAHPHEGASNVWHGIEICNKVFKEAFYYKMAGSIYRNPRNDEWYSSPPSKLRMKKNYLEL